MKIKHIIGETRYIELLKKFGGQNQQPRKNS
jgi:hypothetical protein